MAACIKHGKDSYLDPMGLKTLNNSWPVGGFACCRIRRFFVHGRDEQMSGAETAEGGVNPYTELWWHDLMPGMR